MASMEAYAAAFPGKQFQQPQAASPMQSNNDDGNVVATSATAAIGASSSSLSTTNPPHPLSAWRLRDAAQRLTQDRLALLPASATTTTAVAAHKGGSKQRSSTTLADTLWLAHTDDFEVTTSLEVLRQHKRNEIRAAFSAAATVVLQAVARKARGESVADDAEEEEQEDEDATTTRGDDVNGNDYYNDPNLPRALLERRHMAQLRQAAMTRSLDNKEWAKKRTPVAAAAGGATAAGASAAPAKGKGSRKRKSTDSLTPTTAASSALALSSSSGHKKNTLAESGDMMAVVADAALSGSSSHTLSGAGATASSAAAPKFTRNTPASSAAALDHRFTSSRAILCAAGNLIFKALTPAIQGHELEPNEVPQQKASKVNLGAVLVDANVYAHRTIAIVENATKRADQRYLYQKQNARYNSRTIAEHHRANGGGPHKHFLQLPNLFGNNPNSKGFTSNSSSSSSSLMPWSDFVFDEETSIRYNPNEESLTEPWQTFCLPRLRAILEKGAGHVLYHDVQWFSRHGRLAHFLKTLRRPDGVTAATTVIPDEGEDGENGATATSRKHVSQSFGPHLIVTLTPDVTKFAQEFHDMKTHTPIVIDSDDEQDNQLRVLVYDGSKADRRKLRMQFPEANGLVESPFHVVVVSYTSFLQDYLHFCQVNFEVVILDDGASWMGASHGDPNSSLATIWDQAIWSKHQHVGVAGTVLGADPWDFAMDKISETAIKDACIGLTARHRVITASHLVAENKSTTDVLPVSAIVSFLAPIFTAVVSEEWNRANIAKDTESMDHFRKLVCRSTVIHHESSPIRDMHELALLGLEGQMGESERFGDPNVPAFISDDDFVASDKATFSRRSSLSWLGTKSVDWLRYELGTANFKHILDYMKTSSKHGHFCEEITTASSTTVSGANGQVSGSLAYRMAVCCARSFGSEQGLRQHISAQHAPPGTWLCRSCQIDCITSQARTHHERTCGQPTGGSPEANGAVGAPPTVGQGGSKGVGKKKSRGANAQQGSVSPDDKDPDGSLRVPGYRGVWVNKAGKHFIKIDKKRYTGDGEEAVLFDSNDAAARKYDEIISEKAGENEKLELNFKPDGTRNMYEDSSSTTSGLGGSASNVVPLLSVINIKDLPPSVKPLLRDPRQTSRTGGNSKRHVYAYRGVCRQARKGHDRWQSQISFMGVNHYLGTFDSEWDAAAIYAWAHLILYGEEATRQAQKEGEEAAEAFEQEKRDIAAGKIPAEAPKPEKPKRQQKRKTDTKKTKSPKADPDAAGKDEKAEGGKKRKAKPKPKETAPSGDKKQKVNPQSSKHERDAMNATLAQGVAKTPVLGEREQFEGVDMDHLEILVRERLRASRNIAYNVAKGEQHPSTSPAVEPLRPCLPMKDSRGNSPLATALLVGLPHDLGWNLEEFVETNVDDETLVMTAVQVLAAEYDEDGVNEKFRSAIQGSVAIIGRCTERQSRIFRELVGTSLSVGRGAGDIDCSVGGVPGTCSTRAACIRHTTGEFSLCCMNDHDVVTLNGTRISTEMEWVTLQHNDVISVGPRVFFFCLPVK